MFNTRVQIPTSDNVPIEIMQSLKNQGVQYLSTTTGTTNKWSVIPSHSEVYFIDNLNKNFYSLTGNNQVRDISKDLLFKSWSDKNLQDSREFSIDNEGAWITNIDLDKNDIYFNNQFSSLRLSERLGQFETFTYHRNIP